VIQRFRLQRFKGHTDTTVPLGRLTVLVGDNASGKTSVLQALGLHTTALYRGVVAPSPQRLRQHGSSEPICLTSEGLDEGAPWSFESVFAREPLGNSEIDTVEVAGSVRGQRLQDALVFDGNRALVSRGPDGTWDRRLVSQVFRGARMYRFAGSAIASPSAANDSKFVGEDGRRTARVLAHLRLADDAAFSAIEAAARVIVPSLRAIRIDDYVEDAFDDRDDVPGYERGAYYRIRLSFEGCPDLPAGHASEGTLVTLALLTVLYSPQRAQVIMLDDFDQSLHPRAQMELVRQLRRLLALPAFSDLQIVATTHSPYILDELSPDEVHAFAMRADGTVASKRLSEHPEAGKVPGALRTGELWTLDAERDWVLGG
jgi:predicted ATPase